MRRRALLPEIRPWRAADHHTGITRFDGRPSTYEHVDAPPSSAEVYRVELERERKRALAAELDAVKARRSDVPSLDAERLRGEFRRHVADVPVDYLVGMFYKRVRSFGSSWWAR